MTTEMCNSVANSECSDESVAALARFILDTPVTEWPEINLPSHTVGSYMQGGDFYPHIELVGGK